MHFIENGCVMSFDLYNKGKPTCSKYDKCSDKADLENTGNTVDLHSNVRTPSGYPTSCKTEAKVWKVKVEKEVETNSNLPSHIPTPRAMGGLAFTYWSGTLNKSVKWIRASGLNTCVGLVIAKRKKGWSKGFDEVLAFHFGGAGSNTKRKAKAWKSVLDNAPGVISETIRKWKMDPTKLHAIVVAGPYHPGKPSDLEEDYRTLIQNRVFGCEVLFWAGDYNDEKTKVYENPLVPQGQAQSYARVQVGHDGKGYAWRK
jgi:hypothetical protein